MKATPRAKSLIDSGASTGEMGGCKPDDYFDTTPLICAIEGNRIEIVKLLLAKGADVSQIEQFGDTPLMAAAGVDIEMVKLLLDKGADINGRGMGWRAGRTALMSAAGEGKIDIVKLLLARGAEIEARNMYGWTALGIAAASKQTAIAKLLIARGADADYAISKAESHAAESKDAKSQANDREVVALLRDLRNTVKTCAVKTRSDASSEPAFRDAAARYRSMAVKPELPEEAREFRVQAEYALGQNQFQNAVDLYAKALKLSPWWPEGYFNQALILGEMSCPEEAIAAMNKYIELVPGAPDVRAARDKIYQWKAMIP